MLALGCIAEERGTYERVCREAASTLDAIPTIFVLLLIHIFRHLSVVLSSISKRLRKQPLSFLVEFGILFRFAFASHAGGYSLETVW